MLQAFVLSIDHPYVYLQVPVVPGLTWTLPCPKGITVTAAQLKHRVPCWGYVFQEASVTDGAPGRKVVLLGDTCNSEAIAGSVLLHLTDDVSIILAVICRAVKS